MTLSPATPTGDPGASTPFGKSSSFSEEGLIYDYLLIESPQPSLYVFFSGSVKRAKRPLPIFQRCSWAPMFPGTCLYLADPTLHLHKDLGVAWYMGIGDQDPLTVYSKLIIQIAQKKSIPESEIYLYGSSAGGFAALRITRFLPKATAIAINPQTQLPSYHGSHFAQALASCASGIQKHQAGRLLKSRVDVLYDIDHLRHTPVVYAQNIWDRHHFTQHFSPLVKALDLEISTGYSSPSFRTVFFDEPGGHRKAEPKQLVQHLLQQAKSINR